MSNEILDLTSISKTLDNMCQQILPDLLPGGKLVGLEWCCANIYGQPGNSFKYNIEKHAFKDFADSDGGGKGLAALYSKQKSMDWGAAVKELHQRYIGTAAPIIKYNYPVKEDREKISIIKPPLDCGEPDFPANSERWKYTNERGETLYYIVKFKDNSGKKMFYPLSFTTDNLWVKKQYSEHVLYGLDDLAKDLTKPVLIVEGEKCKDAAKKHMKAYIAVTWDGGAQSWKRTDWSVLKGRKALLWPDADAPGIKAMNDIAAHLLNNNIVTELKMINTDKKDGWDCSDAFDLEGWDYKTFASWARPITSVHVPVKQVEVIEESQEEIPASNAVEDLTDLIPTQDFPVSPNMQMRFIDLGMQFSDIRQTKVVMNASNVAKIIRADFPNIVWRDVFYGKIFTKWRTGVERQWSDNDTNNLFIEMQHHYELAKIGKSNIEDAINFVASKNEKNEPKEWLQSLKWDGTSRITDFFSKEMGAEESSYTRAVSKNFWVAIVARIMDPGCKADEMVVLEGKQGTYKTTSLEIIGGKWYGEVNCDIASKDFDQGLKGKILVEFGELANLRKADVETIKRKLSTRIDEYRPSYGRHVEQHPRTCIFVGTTNETEYLKDPTGNRRFWPMKIQRADTESIKKNRDQYFAEALARYKDGDRWHEVPWDEAEQVRASRFEVDEIASEIEKLLKEGRYQTSYFSLVDIWKDLGGMVDKFSRKDQQRIGSILRELGCKKVYIRTDDKTTRGWSI